MSETDITTFHAPLSDKGVEYDVHPIPDFTDDYEAPAPTQTMEGSKVAILASDRTTFSTFIIPRWGTPALEAIQIVSRAGNNERKRVTIVANNAGFVLFNYPMKNNPVTSQVNGSPVYSDGFLYLATSYPLIFETCEELWAIGAGTDVGEDTYLSVAVESYFRNV